MVGVFWMISLLVGAAVASPDRKMSFTNTDHDGAVRLERVANGINNAFEFRFDTDGFPRFRTLYFPRSSVSTANFKYRVGLLRLFEVESLDLSEFHPNAVLSMYSLMGRAGNWSRFAMDSVTGASVHGVSTLKDQQEGMEFTVSVSSAGVALQKGANLTLGPDRLHLHVEIRRFPFTRPNTYLGLLATIQSRTPRRLLNATAQTGWLGVSGGGRISWQRQAWTQASASAGGSGDGTASAAGSWVPVHWSPLLQDNLDYTAAKGQDDDMDATESSHLLAFVFSDRSQPELISWDPEFMLSEEELGLSSAPRFGSAAGATSALCATLTLLALAVLRLRP